MRLINPIKGRVLRAGYLLWVMPSGIQRSSCMPADRIASIDATAIILTCRVSEVMCVTKCPKAEVMLQLDEVMSLMCPIQYHVLLIA